MSVKINKDGNLVIVSNENYQTWHTYHSRIHALIYIIKMKDKDYIDDDTIWHVLNILEDYMPSSEQCEAMLKAEIDNIEYPFKTNETAKASLKPIDCLTK